MRFVCAMLTIHCYLNVIVTVAVVVSIPEIVQKKGDGSSGVGHSCLLFFMMTDSLGLPTAAYCSSCYVLRLMCNSVRYLLMPVLEKKGA